MTSTLFNSCSKTISIYLSQSKSIVAGLAARQITCRRNFNAAAAMSYDKNYVEFFNGKKMPIVGLGTWQSGPGEVKAAVLAALDAGYRHIDTAYAYANEKQIGEALQETFAKGKLKREDLFIVTKLPPNGIRPGEVQHFLKKSLSNLQLYYVDLYLIHTAFGFENINDDAIFPKGADGRLILDKTTDHVATWKKMEEMVDQGLTKSIGLSNFGRTQIQRILDNCRIKPANHQVELHLYLQQQRLLDFCTERGITVCAYSPLGSPGYPAFLQRAHNIPNVVFPSHLEDPVVKRIADKHHKAASQVLLRFLMQRGIVVIPKSITPQRIKDNFNVFDFKLDAADIKELTALDRNSRMFNWIRYPGVEEHPELINFMKSEME